jgi:hypothetical protein
MEDAFEKALKKLTNWQRNQWAKAGYPGQQPTDRDVSKVQKFLDLVRSHNYGGA